MAARETLKLDDRQAYETAVGKVRAWADAYYNSDTLLVDDDEYDAMLHAIAAAEAEHGWASGVGAVAAGVGTGDVAHRRRMLSLDNAMDEEELAGWLAKVDGTTASLLAEPKLDGLAVVARYQGGVLIQLATRGDGSAGEDVTARARMIVGLPARLTEPADCELRGECYLDHAGLADANIERAARGKAPFVNARNAVAGMIRSKNDPYNTPLRFAAYDFDEPGAAPVARYSDQMGRARRLGVNVALDLVEQRDDVAELVRSLRAERDQLGYDIDGCVIKVDQLAERQRLGESSRAPRWAIAYKFPAETRRTRLTGIAVEIGRSGVLTFTAELEPVFVGQATVRAATLHNVADMRRRIGTDDGIFVNVDVFVRRAGDVIPEIVGLAGPVGAQAQRWTEPTTCPRCSAALIQAGPKLHCSQGRNCGLVEWINYAVSRDCLDIEGLGQTLVAELVKAGTIRAISDLYRLDEAALVAIERVGDKRARQILDQIELARTKPLARQLAALGIASTGRRISARLAEAFTTMDQLLAADVGALETVDGVGAKKALVIAEGLQDMNDEIAQLAALGVNLTHSGNERDAAGPFAQKSVCVTGTIPGVGRDDAQALVAAAGGRAASSVSAKLDILVAGDKAGSKLAKAQQLGVTVLTAEEFLAAVASYR